MRLGLVQAHLAKGEKTTLKGGKFYKKGGKCYCFSFDFDV